jgi:predicted PhzF superfamily epimerase YddE/YHI9
LLTARSIADAIEMDFPAEPCFPAADSDVADSGALLEALETPTGAVRFTGRNRFDWLVELASDADVRALRPDFRKLAQIGGRGVIVTARSADPAYDFVSRFFAPAAGIDEDPVTGSAHCCLAPYWAERLGRSRLVGYQASARGGIVAVDRRPPRVLLIGQAITVIAGEWASHAEPPR